jgi:hypothetical protein
VDEAGVPGRQRDRDAGADDGPLAGGERDVRRAAQVHTRVPGVRVRGHGQALVEPRERHVDRVCGAVPGATGSFTRHGASSPTILVAAPAGPARRDVDLARPVTAGTTLPSQV